MYVSVYVPTSIVAQHLHDIQKRVVDGLQAWCMQVLIYSHLKMGLCSKTRLNLNILNTHFRKEIKHCPQVHKFVTNGPGSKTMHSFSRIFSPVVLHE